MATGNDESLLKLFKRLSNHPLSCAGLEKIIAMSSGFRGLERVSGFGFAYFSP
jgi:hypothetical protein